MKTRRLIREAAKAMLVSKTIAGLNVASSRPNPLSQRPSAHGGLEELPAVIIYTRSTKSEVFDESPRRYRHEAELAVECAMEIDPDQELDDQLDDFEQQVVDALLIDDTLGGIAEDLKLTGSTNTIDGTGEKLLGAVIITFQAVYFTDLPESILEDLPNFSTAHTEYSLGGQQEDTRDRAKTHLQGLEQ